MAELNLVFVGLLFYQDDGMKVIIVLMFFGMAAAYTDMDDTLSVEDLVKDKPRFQGEVSCFMDKGPCSQQYMSYKKHLLEVVNDGCRECNDRERHMFRVFLKGLRDNLPAEYKAFRDKYDPDNKHFDAAAAAVQSY